MKEWTKKLYVFILKYGAPVEDLRAFIGATKLDGEDIEWIEDDTYPLYEDTYRYRTIERLIRHELYWQNKK